MDAARATPRDPARRRAAHGWRSDPAASAGFAMLQAAPGTQPTLTGEAPIVPPGDAGALLAPPSFPPTVEVPQEVPGDLSLDTVLSPYVIVFCIAFLIAYLFTPIMRTIAVAYGIIDRPDLDRKVHARPVAYLGGVAVFLGFVAGLAACQRFSENHNPALIGAERLVKIPLSFVVSTCLIVALGLFDDLRGVRPILKIFGQVAAAVCLLYFGIGDGLADQFVTYGFSWLHNHFGLQTPAGVEEAISRVASALLVVTIVVFCCNASNLMDGLDGLLGGITAIIAFGLIAVAAHLAMTGPAERAQDDAVRLVLAIALFGAVLGFLPFNFNPASIFMGDTGSLLLGFVVATSIILLGEAGGKWMLGGLVMFSLPVLDTALAFARRYVNRRPFFAPDKQHFHHQLVMRGLSVRRAVMLSYGLTIFFVAAGGLLVFLRTRYAVAFYLVLFGSIIVAAYKMGMVHERPRRSAEDGQPELFPSDEEDPATSDVAGEGDLERDADVQPAR